MPNPSFMMAIRSYVALSIGFQPTEGSTAKLNKASYQARNLPLKCFRVYVKNAGFELNKNG